MQGLLEGRTLLIQAVEVGLLHLGQTDLRQMQVVGG